MCNVRIHVSLYEFVESLAECDYESWDLLLSTRPRLDRYLDDERLQKFIDTVELDNTYPKMDLVILVMDLLAIENMDFLRDGREGEESYLCRLLFSIWGPARVRDMLRDAENRIEMSVVTFDQRERLGLMDAW